MKLEKIGIEMRAVWEHHAKSAATAQQNSAKKKAIATLKQLLSRINNTQNKMLLEIGCGGGELLLAASKHFASVSGVDISRSRIEQAKKKTKSSANIDLKENNGFDLRNLTDKSADIIISHSTFQWMPPDVIASYLSEMHRVLSDNGIARIQILLGHWKQSENGPYVYRQSSFLSACRAGGFKVNLISEKHIPTVNKIISREAVVELVKTPTKPKKLAAISAILLAPGMEKITRIITPESSFKSFDNKLNSPNIDRYNKADNIRLKAAYEKYLGLRSGGANLLNVIAQMATPQLELLTDAIKNIRKSGRVFIIGNGGSFDNSRAIVNALSRAGVVARIPGNTDQFLSENYEQIFVTALKTEALRKEDIVIGISGSGNSPNILNALNYANQKGADTYALGGRDGGKMRVIAGDDKTILAKCEIMEAIEDAHLAAGIAIAQSIASNSEVSMVIKDFRDALKKDLTSSNISKLLKFGNHIKQLIYSESQFFVIGNGVGSTHLRSDAQRGFTNAVPVRGICAPELFSTNSAMATANDDGIDFILIDGLVKFKTDKNDFAVIFNFPENLKQIEMCTEWLSSNRVKSMTVGAKGSDIEFIHLAAKYDCEFIPTLLAHSTGSILREILWEEWCIREIKYDLSDILGSQRKLSSLNTESLTVKLRKKGLISTKEVITFCYGKIYAAIDPKYFGLKWEHY